MIQIAGGVLLAVLVLALLPWIFAGLWWAFSVVLVLAIGGLIAWAVWTFGGVFLPWLYSAQSLGGITTEFILGGVFLIWLYYEIKARRGAKADLHGD